MYASMYLTLAFINVVSQVQHARALTKAARRWETDGEEEEATVMAPAGIVLVVEVEAGDLVEA